MITCIKLWGLIIAATGAATMAISVTILFNYYYAPSVFGVGLITFSCGLAWAVTAGRLK